MVTFLIRIIPYHCKQNLFSLNLFHDYQSRKLKNGMFHPQGEGTRREHLPHQDVFLRGDGAFGIDLFSWVGDISCVEEVFEGFVFLF